MNRYWTVRYGGGRSLPLEQRARWVGGLALIMLGLLALTLQVTGPFGHAVLLLVLAALLFAAFAGRRMLLFLIAGLLVAGVGFAELAAPLLGITREVDGIGLGLGLLALSLYSLRTGRRGSRLALVLGGVLVVAGLAQNSTVVERYAYALWPLLLILVGVVALVRALPLDRHRRQQW